MQIDIFPYSVFYIFFEQYLNIWTVALTNLAIAIGAIFIVCWLITSSAWSSAIIVLVLVMILVDLMGMMVILGIQLNAVSVVNLIMSIGIAVEFCVHISHAFLVRTSHAPLQPYPEHYTAYIGTTICSHVVAEQPSSQLSTTYWLSGYKDAEQAMFPFDLAWICSEK
jgi:hypothetical protein